MLAQHFLDELNTTENSAKRFAPSAAASLYAHSWPGNVRELKNYVQRAYLLADAVIDDYARVRRIVRKLPITTTRSR